MVLKKHWEPLSLLIAESHSPEIMRFKRLLTIICVCICDVLANPLQLPDTQTLVLGESKNLTNSMFASNATTNVSAQNTSFGRSLTLSCNGTRYGFNPNIADCEGAVALIVPDTDQMVWGLRHTGLSPDDVFPLPFVVFGGKL